MNANTNNLQVTRLIVELGEPAPVKTKTTAPVTPAPVKAQTKTTAPVTPAPVKAQTKTTAPVTPAPAKRDWLRTIGSILLGLLGLLLIIALAWFLFNQLAKPTGTSDTSSASAPASAPITAPIDSALESPDARSAGSNQNFIGYFGSRGQGWVVPSQVLDTSKATRDVGSVLFTWCETRTNCFYQILHPGDIITTGHQGSQVNIYSREYMGLESNELQYIATEANTNWTAVK